MNNKFDWVIWIPMRVPKTLGIEYIYLFAMLLSVLSVEEEFYFGMWASVWLFDARRCVINIFVVGLRWND
jgi:hypothetical protein